MTNRRKQLDERIAALEAELRPLPVQNIYFGIPDERLEADEELVITYERPWATGWMRSFEKRKKIQ